jgi:guanylate kinase
MQKKSLILVVGPSGVGKSTIVNAIVAKLPDLFEICVSTTTRDPRSGEVDGVDYWYRTQEFFQNLIDTNGLLEHIEYLGNQYGLEQGIVGQVIDERQKHALLIVETEGAEQIKARYDGPIITIFLMAPDLQELQSRMSGRGEDGAAVSKRMMTVDSRFYSHAHKYDYVLINNVVDVTVSQVINIVRQDELRERVEQLYLSQLKEKVEGMWIDV